MDDRPDIDDPILTIDEAVVLLIDGEVDRVIRAFTPKGGHASAIVWNPDVNTLPTKILPTFLSTWRALPCDPVLGLPRAAAFDVLNFQDVVGFMMLLDVLDDGTDFRYRVYGSRIAESSGFDQTGKLLSHLPTSDLSIRFYTAGYRALLRRREPLFTEHNPPDDKTVLTWSRIVVPLIDDSGSVCRILGATCPAASGSLLAACGRCMANRSVVFP